MMSDEWSCGVFFFKQKTAYEIEYGLVGSEMCIRDSTRAVLDSLTDAGIFTDDSRVVAIDACKITSVGRDGTSGVYVGVKPMEGA